MRVSESTSPLRRKVQALLTRARGTSVGAIVIRGASVSLVATLVGTGLGFALSILLTRTMGEAHYGIYVYAMTWIRMLMTVTKLGWETVLVRFLPVYKRNGLWGLTTGIFRYSTRISLGVSIAVAAIVAGIAWWLRNRLEPELVTSFYIGSALFPLLTLGALRAASLRAYHRIAWAQLPAQLLRPLVIGSCLGLILLMGTRPITGTTTIFLEVCAAGLVLVVSTLALMRLQPRGVGTTPPTYARSEWWDLALPMLIASGLQIALAQGDMLLVGAMADMADTGRYGVCVKLAGLLALGNTAVIAIAAPLISELHAAKKHEELQRMIILATRGIFAFSLPAGAVLIIGGKWILGIFGPTFPEAYPVLAILAVAHLGNALVGPIGMITIMTGHQKVIVRYTALCLLMSLATSALLIPIIGTIGAAIGTLIATWSWDVLVAYFVWKRLHLRVTII